MNEQLLIEYEMTMHNNVILSRSEGSHNNQILRSLHSLRMTGDRTAPSLIVRGQNFLKNVVNLEIRERVKGKEIFRSLHSLRMTWGKGVNVFSLSKGEGQGEGFITNLRKELINLSTYPPINFKKVAFTLAEVLITLGIIGVVAAMTIPNLIQNNFEKRAISQLRETQSIISQAMRMSEEEYGDVEGWELKQDEESALKIANNLKPFLKYHIFQSIFISLIFFIISYGLELILKFLSCRFKLKII